MGVKEDKPNTPKKPFIYYYTIMMVVLMALNLFLMPMYRSSQVTEVPYSTFLDMVDQGVVTSVERSDDEIVFLVKTGNKTMFGDDEIAQYKTGPWPDNNLEDTALYGKAITSVSSRNSSIRRGLDDKPR